MKVWVTRDEPADGPLSAALRDAGLEPVLEPVITRRVLTDARSHIAALGPDDWLVLTSVYAVEAVAVEGGCAARVAVVGEASRRAALVSADGTGAGLFRELPERAAGSTVLYPRSSLAEEPRLPPGFRFISPILYETVRRAWRTGIVHRVDVIAVASRSAVHAVGTIDLPFASIGPTTTAALRLAGIEPWVEAAEPSFEALARAIADQGASSRSQRA
ncbi:MAG: uroporphyrinogen-III synthase [Planctomycetota bacterium]